MLTGKEILDIEMPSNDAHAKTVRNYLIALLHTLWAEGDSFSGKRPFGNSGWTYDLCDALHNAGLVQDEASDDVETCDKLIHDAIQALGNEEIENNDQ